MRSATRADRLAFWTAVSAFVAEAKADELAAGLDKSGNPFAPLKPRTIKYRHSAMGPADPNAPALQPAHGLSRTRSLFRAEATSSADGVVCFWAFDSHTGDSWGQILDYHRMGAGALPVRDVFGLSPASIATVKRRANDWWRGYILGLGVTILPPPQPVPTPGPTGRGGGPPVPGWKPKGSGWGRVTILPGTGPRSRTETIRMRIKGGNHHYDIQGGLGASRPGPPMPGSTHPLIPRPPTLPTAGAIRKRTTSG